MSSTPTMLDLPETVYLEIATWLDLKDAVTFTQICATLRAVGDLRSFWAPVLEHTRQEKPLNCPPYQRLLELFPSRLREMALHRLRLDHNWARSLPICGPIKSIDVNAQDVLALVSATDIIIVHQLSKGKVVCWDAETAQQTFQLDIPHGSHIQGCSSPHQIPGQLTIAFRYGYPYCYLCVLCVDHKGGKATGLRQIFHSALDMYMDHFRPFLFEDVVGMISRTQDGPMISAFNVKSGEHVLIPTNLPASFNDCRQISSFIFGTTLYVVMEEDLELHVWRCSCDVLPTCSKTPRETTAVFKHSDITPLADPCPHGVYYPEGLVPVGTPTHGVAALSVYEHSDFLDSPEQYAFIRFWPSSNSRSGPSGDPYLVIGDAKGHDIHIPGTLMAYCGSPMGFVANCGTTMVIMTRGPEPSKVCINLVRYVAGTVSTHELKLPPSVTVAETTCIRVDDYKGTVYLLNKAGILHCIPYA